MRNIAEERCPNRREDDAHGPPWRSRLGSAIVELQLGWYGLDHRLEQVGDLFLSAESRAALARVDPVAQVPVLVLEDGRVVTESAAITLLLADLTGSDALVPGAGTASAGRSAAGAGACFESSRVRRVIPGSSASGSRPSTSISRCSPAGSPAPAGSPRGHRSPGRSVRRSGARRRSPPSPSVTFRTHERAQRQPMNGLVVVVSRDSWAILSSSASGVARGGFGGAAGRWLGCSAGLAWERLWGQDSFRWRKRVLTP